MSNKQRTHWVSKGTLLGLCLFGLLLPNAFSAAPLPPVITEQPQSQGVAAGATATFQVAVTSFGSTFYQWRKDGVDIVGATDSSYTIAGVQPSDAADYSVEVSNAHGWTTSASAALTVMAVNTAPVLDPSKSPALAAVNQDADAPVGPIGTLVSNLVDSSSPTVQVYNLTDSDSASLLESADTDFPSLTRRLDNVTDADSGALLGIAVTAADTAHGAWFYSINNGTTWNGLGVVSDSNARLLAADAHTRLYFQPNPGYNGTLANAITFRAWDQTSGTNGGIADIPSAPHTVADLFNTTSYSNNNGTEPWAADWVESDTEGGGASSGCISVTAGELRVRTLHANDEIYREANLNGIQSATLSLAYQNSTVSPGAIVLQVSGNGGGSYTTLMLFDGDTNTGSGKASIDISSYTAANTRIRFLVQSGTGIQDNIRVDGVWLHYLHGGGGGSTAFSTAIATASLVVTDPPPPLLSTAGSARMTSEGFSFGLSVPVGATYVVEASSNYQHWTPIATNVAASASVVFTDPAAASFPMRFYRAVLQ